MKAIIENSVNIINPKTGINFRENKYFECLSEFDLILTNITTAKNEEALRAHFKFGSYRNFKVGFGSNHMWVKQIIDGEIKQQVIFVEF